MDGVLGLMDGALGLMDGALGLVDGVLGLMDGALGLVDGVDWLGSLRSSPSWIAGCFHPHAATLNDT